MIDTVLWSLWFFLPAGLATLAPILATKAPLIRNYKAPMDFGKTYKGTRILGDTKTWRGLIVGIGAGVAVGGLQMLIFTLAQPSFVHTSVFDYGSWTTLWLGGALGVGAIVGDAVKSFFKRRIGVPPSESWLVFDQIDYIIGGCICAAVFVVLPLPDYLVILGVWFGIHVLFGYIGYVTGFKKTPI